MRCDIKKFAKMYEEIYVDLYRFSLCMMKNVPDAEDAVSEAVLTAYENIRKLREEQAFKSWMFSKRLISGYTIKMCSGLHGKNPERKRFTLFYTAQLLHTFIPRS